MSHASHSRAIGIAAPLVLCCLLSACEGREPIRIGVALRDHGTLGASLAVAEVNARGGVRGRPLEIRYERAGEMAGSETALAAAERFTGDRSVVAVVGHERSSASLAASQVYNARGLVQIAPNSSAPLYGSAGPWSFGLVPSDSHQGEFLARELLVRSPRARIAILYNSGDYGRSLRGSIVGHVRAGGATLVYDSPFDEREIAGDRLELAAAVSRARPDLLVWVGSARVFVPLHVELRSRLPQLRVVAGDAFGDADVARTNPVLGGARYVRLLGLDHRDARFAELRERYARAGGGQLTDQGILAYDAIWLLAAAIEAQGPDRERIREWLAAPAGSRPAFRGLSGPIPFPLSAFRSVPYIIDEVPVVPGGLGATGDDATKGPGSTR